MRFISKDRKRAWYWTNNAKDLFIVCINDVAGGLSNLSHLHYHFIVVLLIFLSQVLIEYVIAILSKAKIVFLNDIIVLFVQECQETPFLLILPSHRQHLRVRVDALLCERSLQLRRVECDCDLPLAFTGTETDTLFRPHSVAGLVVSLASNDTTCTLMYSLMSRTPLMTSGEGNSYAGRMCFNHAFQYSFSNIVKDVAVLCIAVARSSCPFSFSLADMESHQR